MTMNSHTKILLFLLLTLLFVAIVTCNNSNDKEECEGSVVKLGTCLSYVGGNAKSPTQDCCNGLKQVLETSKKCLCFVIKDRNEPELGVHINVTLALGLPKACNVPANNSKCPELLNLPPDSPDAQIFYQSNDTTSTNHDANVKSNTTSTPGSRAHQKSGGNGNGKRFIGLEIMGLFWAFTANFIV